MMASRRNPRPARRSSLTKTPRSSGPRCTSRSRIATIVSARTGAPSNVSSPQMPHIFYFAVGPHPHRPCLRGLRRSALLSATFRLVSINIRALLCLLTESAFQECVHGIDAVRPPDLLPFVDAARVVAHRHLDDAAAGAEELGGE